VCDVTCEIRRKPFVGRWLVEIARDSKEIVRKGREVMEPEKPEEPQPEEVDDGRSGAERNA
jgi:hypothetical protein